MKECGVQESVTMADRICDEDGCLVGMKASGMIWIRLERLKRGKTTI